MNKPAFESLCLQQAVGSFALVALVTLGSGCNPPEPLPPDIQKQLVSNPSEVNSDSSAEEAAQQSSKPAQPAIDQCAVNDEEWIRRDQLPWTYSEVQYVGNTRTGYSTVTVDRSELAELKQLSILRVDVIDRAMDGSPAPQRNVTLQTFERPNGELASFRFESKVAGVNDLLVEGRVIFNDLEVTKKEGNAPPIRTKIPWVRENWGPFGIQSVLMRQTMKKGELRTTKIFIPQLVQFVPVVFEAKGMELTPVAEGKIQELLLIDLTIGTPESGVLSSVFVDETGVIQKTITRSGQSMLTLQVPGEIVQRIADQSQFSLGITKITAVTGEVSTLSQGDTVRFEVDAEDQDPYDVLLSYHRQQLKSINPDRCELTIAAVSAPHTNLSEEQSPDETQLESSVLIPTDKELTGSITAELLAGNDSSNDGEKAETLRVGLQRVWKLQPIATEINSTLVAARDRSGSCIECSHLLAALLRHEKIAARIVCGLRIDPASSEAHFHTWNQAWIEGKWIDLDATIPGPVGGLHIAMSTFSGSGQNPYSHYLTVLKTIATLRGLRVVSL